MIDVYVTGSSVNIGRQGENNARNIYFDLTDLTTDYGEGTATLVHMRPSDQAPYVCETETDGSYLVWTPSSTDTAYSGAGKCELRWVVGETLAKSIIYTTTIAPSITGAGEVPDPYESWYDALLEHISEYVIAENEISELSEKIATNVSNIAANASDIAVLDGRMDEFTRLPDGSTTGDAELADIRVGADGTTYETAGDAVRTQINDVKSALTEEILNLGKTFELTWVSGYTINGNSSTGSFSIAEYEGRRYSGPFRSLTDFTVVPTIRSVSVIATDDDGKCTLNTSWFSQKRTIQASSGKNFYILCSFDNDTDVPSVLVEGELTGIESLNDAIEYVISHNVFEFSRGTTSNGTTFTDSVWRMYQTFISVLPFDLKIPVNTLSRICVYTYSDTEGSNPVEHWDANVNSDYTIPANTPFRMMVMYRSGVSGTQLDDKAGMYETPLYKSLVFYAGNYTGYNLMNNIENEFVKLRYIPINNNFRVINHRGYSQQYPENTILAFKKSKERGFNTVETDVRFTSDDVAVLLHDASINRTARNADGSAISGTVNIDSITYEQALTYDFGIFKGFAGEKIPTFEQFIVLCKRIGLHPYVELKVGTQTQINEVCNIVIKNGMRKQVTWISYSLTLLNYVKNVDKYARIGLISNTIVAQNLTDAGSLRTGDNEVFVSTDYNNVTDTIVNMCIASDIPMEVFTVDSYDALENLNNYYSGITTDWLIADKYLYTKSFE